MSTIYPFGQASRTRRNRHRAALMIGVSFAAILVLTPAKAGTITYSGGEIRSAPIILTEEYALVVAGNPYQSGLISGAFGIVKHGAGTLSINGNNTFTGGTIIDEGAVSMHHASALGTGTITLQNNGRLWMSYGTPMTLSNALVLNGTGGLLAVNTTTYNGTISGSSGLKLDYGQLRLAAANTYAGDTLIGATGLAYIEALNDQAFSAGTVRLGTSGSLQLGDGVTIANNVVLAGGGGLNALQANGVATLSGDIGSASAGGILVYRGGELILTGSSDYSAQTYVSGGILTGGAVNSLAAASVFHIERNGTLRLLADQEVAGIVDGGSSFGAGTLDLTNRRLTSSQDGNTTFGGTITGTENSRIILSGAGTLNLTGDNSGYTGSLITSSGRFDINGDLSSATALITGGQLGGTGHLGYVGLSRGGKLVGVSGQTLTMDRLVMGSGGILSASFGLADNAPLFHVTGSVELDGYIEIHDAGGFGPGLYRLLTYGGTLFDQDAEFGDLPDGVSADDLELQIGNGRIDVISSANAAGGVTFWDGGNAANWNNGSVDGGDGVWGGGDTFTTADGSSNGQLNPAPGFVVFSGQSGQVIVQPAGPEVTGMQFATDGYMLGGGYLRIGAGERLFRVGDGSSAGAGYTATINNAISGDGRLVKADAGRLVLNSSDNNYTGGTEVRGGILEVNGTIGDVLVGADGFLTGAGSVSSAEVFGSIGATGFDMLRIWDDLTLGENARFRLAVDAEGNNGLVEVDGTAYLDGNVEVLASGGDYADGTEYTFLRAEGGIVGTFDGVADNLIFLSAALAYDDNNARLILTRNANGFASVGATPNQVATATAIEAQGVGNALYDRVLTYDVADAQHAFDQLSGEIYATSQNATLRTSQASVEIARDQAQAALARLGDTSNGGDASSAWSSAGGTVGTIHGDGNAASAAFSAGNLFFGADTVFNDGWVFGAMGGVGNTHVSVPERASIADVQTVMGGIYGGGSFDNTTINFGASASVNQTEVTRDVSIPGLAESVEGSRSGATLQAFGEVGHQFVFDSGLIIEPFANLAHTSLWTGEYSENGGVSGLTGSGAYSSLTSITLGVRGEQGFTIGTIEAKASAGIGWSQPLGLNTPTASHAFDGGQQFTVSGSSAQAGVASIEAGLDLKINDSFNMGFNYDGSLGEGVQQHALKAELSLEF